MIELFAFLFQPIQRSSFWDWYFRCKYPSSVFNRSVRASTWLLLVSYSLNRFFSFGNNRCFFYILGVFGLVNAYAFLKYVQGFLTRREFRYVFFMALVIVIVGGFCAIVALTYLGKQYF